MATMIRKQMYIEEKQQRKLQALTRRWGCTEAELVRRAIDQLADPDDLDSLIVQRLSEAGLLVPPRDYPGLPPPEESDVWEEKEMEWLDSLPALGLGAAVIEERQRGW